MSSKDKGIGFGAFEVQTEEPVVKKVEEPKVKSNKDRPRVTLNETTAKEKIIEYNYKRTQDANVSDSHERVTFLIDEDLLRKIESLQAYLEATNGKDSEIFNTDLNNSQIAKGRKLATGFKTKFVNTAINELLNQYELENGTAPDVQTIRYRYDGTNKVTDTSIKKGKVYRAYFLETDDGYYFIHHDERGRELPDSFKTDDKQKALDKFEFYRDAEIHTGRKPKVQ